eukprot:gene7319-485_t
MPKKVTVLHTCLPYARSRGQSYGCAVGLSVGGTAGEVDGVMPGEEVGPVVGQSVGGMAPEWGKGSRRQPSTGHPVGTAVGRLRTFAIGLVELRWILSTAIVALEG